MTTSRLIAIFTLGLLLAAGCGPAGREAASVAKQEAAAAALAPSLVRVEYTLRFDQGESPDGGGWSSNSFPGQGFGGRGLGGPIREERPFEMAGFVVAPNRVVTSDAMIHPRFIERIAVRQGDEVIPARITSVARDHAAAVLELERPLSKAKPLAFDAGRAGPLQSVTFSPLDGVWSIRVRGFSPLLAVGETGRKSFGAPLQSLIVAQDGTPVGLSVDGTVPADDSWKGSPLDWPMLAADELKKILAEAEKRCNRGLVRVTLYFRSPSKDAAGGRRFRSRDDEEGATERHATGILLPDKRVLVLAGLKPKVTGRLDRIVVHTADGQAVPAKFSQSLLDYGALLATLEKPVVGAVTLGGDNLFDLQFKALPAADIRLHGENRTVFMVHRRLCGFEFGWRRMVFPQIGGGDGTLFLFDAAGALVALPVARREKVSTEEKYSSRDESRLTPAAFLRKVLENLDGQVDPYNVPLTEEEESRLAWLGVELQALNRDLARASKVSEQTRDGETGAMVSYVYPNSPAAQAGIVPGDILLRLHVAGEPKPVDVRVEEDDRGPFPWERLDEVPEQYYDRIPPPWPSAESVFTRALTDLGFGKKFDAEFVHGGKIEKKPFAVVASPPHYESAPRYKAPALGLTVRDLTFEVRRYLARAADAPGVIITKIEPGSKGSVAGVKPFEVITHVNDKPIANVKDFEQAVGKATGELRLSVKRMMKGRVVKIMLGEAGKEAAAVEKPAAKDGPAKGGPKNEPAKSEPAKSVPAKP